MPKVMLPFWLVTANFPKSEVELTIILYTTGKYPTNFRASFPPWSFDRVPIQVSDET